MSACATLPVRGPATKVRLSGRLTTALDATRAFAAIYVVIHHVALSHDVPSPLTVFRHFGHQAVIIFFLLSGFVIFANERQNMSAGSSQYALRRIRRVYPPMLAAMAMSALLAWTDGRLNEEFRWKSLFATLFFQQDIAAATPGTFANPFMNNDPLWSLSYELWFYLLFPVVFRAWLRWPQATSSAVGLLGAGAYALYTVHSSHVLMMSAYFPIWWLGAMIADAYGRGCRTIASVWLPCLGLAGVVVVALWAALLQPGPNQHYPLLQLNHLASALVLAIVFFGAAGRFVVRAVEPFKAVAKVVASFSYGLYVLHYPLLVNWSFAHRPGGIWIAIALLLPLAWAADAGSNLLLRPRRKAGVDREPSILE